MRNGSHPHVKHVLWTGLTALVMLAVAFIRFQTQLPGNPFRGLTGAFVGAVHLELGFAVLVLGATITAFAGWKERQPPPAGE